MQARWAKCSVLWMRCSVYPEGCSMLAMRASRLHANLAGIALQGRLHISKYRLTSCPTMYPLSYLLTMWSRSIFG